MGWFPKGMWKAIGNAGLGVAKYAYGHPQMVQVVLTAAGQPALGAEAAQLIAISQLAKDQGKHVVDDVDPASPPPKA